MKSYEMFESYSSLISIEILIKEELMNIDSMSTNLPFSVAARKFTPREQGERGGCEISRFWSSDRGAG